MIVGQSLPSEWEIHLLDILNRLLGPAERINQLSFLFLPQKLEIVVESEHSLDGVYVVNISGLRDIKNTLRLD